MHFALDAQREITQNETGGEIQLLNIGMRCENY